MHKQYRFSELDVTLHGIGNIHAHTQTNSTSTESTNKQTYNKMKTKIVHCTKHTRSMSL